MAAPSSANPSISPNTYDPVGKQVNVAYRIDNVTTDTSVTPNITYGDLGVQVDVSVSAPTDVTNSGTISAAQSGINTPVPNATVVLALGAGQSAWKAQLLAGGGGFTSGTTIVADKSLDGGTTWFTTSFKVTGASPATTQSTVVGPGPLELTGTAASATHVRIRCSVLNSTETIAVRINAGTGVAEVGIISSIPAGSNLIGQVETVTGAAIALSSPPATTNAGSDTALTFTSKANHWQIQNNTSANAYVALDATASTSSTTLVPGATWRDDIPVTVVHVYTAAAQNVNGTTGIVVLGWA